MIQVINDWFRRNLSDPQAVLLAILLLFSFTVLATLGEFLTPVLASLVLAYLLEGLVEGIMQHQQMPRIWAVLIVFAGFMLLLLFTFLIIVPLLSVQLAQFVGELPVMISKGQAILLQLPEKYPTMISTEQITSIMTSAQQKVQASAQYVLSYSLASITALITFLVYLILVPVMIFFFLKDKIMLTHWFKSFLPTDHHIAKRLWQEMDKQMGNYVRGKVYEIFIVGSISYVAFTYFGLQYAPLLAALVGLSVVVPYIGAAIVTLPVLLVAYFQWGFGNEFYWLAGAYFVIQALDGNVLVPLLFSEAVNLHPVAIIVAVLVFGGVWGFWGVFFAIPLGTLVKALITSWPQVPPDEMLIEPISRRSTSISNESNV